MAPSLMVWLSFGMLHWVSLYLWQARSSRTLYLLYSLHLSGTEDERQHCLAFSTHICTFTWGKSQVVYPSSLRSLWCGSLLLFYAASAAPVAFGFYGLNGRRLAKNWNLPALFHSVSHSTLLCSLFSRSHGSTFFVSNFSTQFFHSIQWSFEKCLSIAC